MSALAPRNSYRIADEQEWLESSDNVDLSPASVWAPDYEEEGETTLQGKRVDAQYIDLMSPNIEKERLVVDTPRQIRILDESQVLPGEASFATVMLGERTKAHRHSPITEFLVKTKLSLKQLVLAMLALVSIPAVAVIVLLSRPSSEVATVSSARPPTTVDTASQSVSTSITESPESLLISISQGKVSGSASPTQVATVEETQSVAKAKWIATPSSGDSRKAPSSDAKSGAVRQEILREINSVGARVYSPEERVIETKKRSASVARKAVKEQAVVNPPNASVRSEPRETRPQPATKQSEVPVIVESVETKTPPITGGGERPRTVTRKPSP